MREGAIELEVERTTARDAVLAVDSRGGREVALVGGVGRGNGAG